MLHEQNPVYIIAVSGGVDSIVLLDMLMKNRIPNFPSKEHARYIVAHVNHGMRQSASRDHDFVKSLAVSNGLEFDSTVLTLGEGASEEEARNERYSFLEKLALKYHTTHIVIAHHADDVVETAIINIIRGTGRTGLSSLRSRQYRIRPLLSTKKADILRYAEENKLKWVDDETNTDTKYLRNHIRNNVLTSATPAWHDKFAIELQKSLKNNDLLDTHIATILQYRFKDKAVLKRTWFVCLEHHVACEIMRAAILKLGILNISKELIERLVIALKIARPGSFIDVDAKTVAYITKRSLRFIDRETKKTLSV